MQQDNLDRREADSSISEEAFAEIENDPIHLNKKSTVVFQPHWHKGVVGIVASRLIERHYKPTNLLYFVSNQTFSMALIVPEIELDNFTVL